MTVLYSNPHYNECYFIKGLSCNSKIIVGYSHPIFFSGVLCTTRRFIIILKSSYWRQENSHNQLCWNLRFSAFFTESAHQPIGLAESTSRQNGNTPKMR